MIKKPNPRGYIAILFVLLITALCTSLLLSASSRVFMTRADQIRHSIKVRSTLLAYSCLFAGLELFAENATYTPHGNTIQIGDDTCMIDQLIVDTTAATLYAHATVLNISAYVRSIVALKPDGTMVLQYMGPSTSTPP